jgi:hypothetical protein
MDEQNRGIRFGRIDGAFVPQEQFHVAFVGPMLGASQALGRFFHGQVFLGLVAVSRSDGIEIGPTALYTGAAAMEIPSFCQIQPPGLCKIQSVRGSKKTGVSS